MRKLLLAAGLLLVLVLPSRSMLNAAADAQSATNLPTGVRFENGFYVFYLLPRVPASHVYTVLGQPVSGGCRYSESVRLAPGSPGVGEQEIAENPHSCQLRVERGLPSSDLERARVGSQALYSSQPALPTNPTHYVVCCGGGGGSSYTAHSFAKFTDVAGKTVTSSYARIDWQTNSGSVIFPATCYTVEYWLAGTGWGQDWRNPKCWLDSQAHSMDSAKYQNGAFCFAQTTYNEYDQTQIDGHGDGSITAEFNFYKSGACESWLSAYHDYTYGA